MSCTLLVWNVRGLNHPGKRSLVAEVVRTSSASIFCCQESKLDVLDRSLSIQSCGHALDGVDFIPADGTRGGGLFMAWRHDCFSVSCLHKGRWSLSLCFSNLEGGASWTLTNVYGPQLDSDKLLFLEELLLVRQLVVGAWCVVGDFNLLAADGDKNNGNVNRRLISKFRHTIDALELREVYLFGRRYTWSNEQGRPTLTKIDKVLVNGDWEEIFRDAHLQALSSSASDHCPCCWPAIR